MNNFEQTSQNILKEEINPFNMSNTTFIQQQWKNLDVNEKVESLIGFLHFIASQNDHETLNKIVDIMGGKYKGPYTR